MQKSLLFLCTLFLASASLKAQFTLNKSNVVFPETTVGSSSQKSVVLSNSSSQTIAFEATSSDNKFVVEPSNFVLEPGKSQSLKLDFEPSTNMFEVAVIFITSNGIYGDQGIVVSGQGRYEDSYYASTQNLEEQALKDELKRIISKGYTNLGYTTCRDKMYSDIDNINGKVTCVYTGRSASFTTRSGANSNSFNCEHTWPQSLFNKSEPERADIHHLFPTDVNANSRRGSYPFGVVSNASWSEGGSKVGGSKFEPRDDHKGDVARAMFYFAIRYQNYSGFLNSQESVLRQWYKSDLPSTKEINRNESIFSYQKNRNPFVDHPEFLDRISSISSTSSKSVILDLCLSRTTLNWINPDVKGAEEFTIVLNNCGNAELNDLKYSLENGVITLHNQAQTLAVDSIVLLRVSVDPSAVSEKGKWSDKITIRNGNTVLDEITFEIETGSVQATNAGGFSLLHSVESQTLSIQTSIEDSFDLQMINQNGQTVKSLTGINQHKSIDLSELKSGVYYIRIQGKASFHIAKIFIP